MSEILPRLSFLTSSLFASTIFLVLFVIAATRGPKILYLRLWAVFCALGATYSALIASVGLGASQGASWVLIKLSLSVGNLGTLAFFLFGIEFSVGLRRIPWLWGIMSIWSLAMIPMFLGTSWLLGGMAESEVTRFAPEAGSFMALYMAFVLFGFSTPFALLLVRHGRAVGIKRTQSGYMLAAFAFLGVGAFGSLIPGVVGYQGLLAFVPSLLLPLGPLLITIAMVRHRLWDVRTVLHKTIGWAAALALLLLPLYGLLWFLGPWLGLLERLDLTVLLALIFLASFGYLRAVKRPVDRFFQRAALDEQRSLDRLARELASLRSLDEVVRAVLGSLGQGLFPKSACLWIRPRGQGAWYTFAWPEGQPLAACPPEGPLPVDGDFARFLVGDGAALGRDHLAVMPGLGPARGEAEAFFVRVGAEVAVPLAQAGGLVGLLTLGERTSLKPYTRREYEFLDRLGAASATALSNALLFDEVNSQRRDLADFSSHLEQRVIERTAELERLNDKLVDANARLRDLDQMKSRFFANISHELRTPLCLILSPVEALLEEAPVADQDPGSRQSLEGVRHHALLLLRLIDDLLDLSKLEEARMRLRLEDVDLAGLAGRLVEATRPLAERKELGLALEAEGRPTPEADPDKLERVLVNLLSNALKFTDPGGQVRIVVGARDAQAFVRVEDDGVGIAAEELGRIFDRFYQVDPSMTRRRGGSGIGLSLARELIELHGGRLEAASQPGQGSRFTAWLPLRADGLPPERIERRLKAEQVEALRREEDAGLGEWTELIRARPDYRYLGLAEATERRVAPRRGGEGRKSARLLVVDDNPDVLRFLDQVLGAEYDLWHLQDGERALELLAAQRHDLVISDVMMPGMSGLELCRRVKTNPKLQDTPVILLTARAADAHRIEGHYVGADQYLTKPFSPAELRAAIEALLTRRSRETESAAHRRAASLETLLAGLAHELRNAAHQAQTAQQAGWQLVRRCLGEGLEPDVDASLKHMEGIARRGLDRIGAVVLSLQRYAFHKLQVPWVELDLAALVQREVERLVAGRTEGAALSLRLEPGAWLRGPQEELRQLVINLVENALQATPLDGRVEVRLETHSGRLRLTVEDTGCGIPPENRERIFDLFFTTKDPGKGIGLGLALVSRAVQDLGGSIQVDSEPGRGTRFVVELPRLEPARPAPPEVAAEVRAPGNERGERSPRGDPGT
jgi:signal transduction histidine kinase